MKESLHIIARRFVVSAESFLKLLEAFDTWQYKSISLIYIIIVYWLKPEDYVHQDYYYVVSAVKLLSAILAAFILLSKPIIKFFEGLLDSVKFDLGQIKIPDDFALVIDGKVTKGEFSASFVDKDSYKVHIMSTGTMGDLAFGGLSYLELGDRCNMYEKWYLHNNSSIVNLYHNDKPIGYVIVLAMRNGIQNRHYKGDVSQFNLDRTSMCPTGEKSNLVYIQALVVKRGYRKNKFVKALVNDALVSLVASKIEDFDDARIYAEAFTRHGANKLYNNGFFTTHIESYDGKKIYELHLNGQRPGYHKKQNGNMSFAQNTIKQLREAYRIINVPKP